MYYWMTGVFVKTGHGKDTDEWAMEHNYISVVPVQLDFTANNVLKPISNWFS
jgi:5'-nucleotidase